MARRIVQALAMVCAAVMVAGCAHPFLKIEKKSGVSQVPQYISTEGYTFFFSPDARARKAGEVFREEYIHINSTMKNAGARALGIPDKKTFRPSSLIGLGVSGGGLRSNAFQLGLLSALHETKGREYSNGTVDDSSALDNIAYISSVSGGSWAAGAMMAYRTKREKGHSLDDFFNELNATVVENRRLARCASGYTTKTDDCVDNATRILNNSYGSAVEVLGKMRWLGNPWSLHEGYTAREAWREMLLGTSLLGLDRQLGDLLVPLDNATKTLDTVLKRSERGPGHSKPFWIINATHSADTSDNNPNHFNFQITPLGVGTMADCGNTRYCGFHGDYTGFYRPFDKPGSFKGFPPITVSHSMAISGAVLPERIMGVKLGMLEWDLPMPKPDAKAMANLTMAINAAKVRNADPVREKYTLADGGHSENYGALALMERGVDLLVISDASYDDNYTFGDYYTLQHHAKTLLNARFAVNATGTNPTNWYGRTLPALDHFDPSVGRYPRGTEVANATRNDLAVYFDKAIGNATSTLNSGAFLGEYCFEENGLLNNGEGQSCQKGGKGHVIYLRPPYSIDGFKDYLLRKDNEVVNSQKNATEVQIQIGIMREAKKNMDNASATQCQNAVNGTENLDSLTFQYDPTPPVPVHGSAEDNATKARAIEVLAPKNPVPQGEIMAYEINNNATISATLKRLARTGQTSTLEGAYDVCSGTRATQFASARDEFNKARKILRDKYEAAKANSNKPDTGYLATYHYLNLNRTDFPRDKTFVSSYDRELIFAYFLLGKYMGEEKLVPLLKEYLSQIKQHR